MAHEQPKRAAEMGHTVSDQKGAELQGCARNPTSPALWVSEGLKSLFLPPWIRFPQLNGTHMGLLPCFSSSLKK